MNKKLTTILIICALVIILLICAGVFYYHIFYPLKDEDRDELPAAPTGVIWADRNNN